MHHIALAHPPLPDKQSAPEKAKMPTGPPPRPKTCGLSFLAMIAFGMTRHKLKDPSIAGQRRCVVRLFPVQWVGIDEHSESNGLDNVCSTQQDTSPEPRVVITRRHDGRNASRTMGLMKEHTSSHIQSQLHTVLLRRTVYTLLRVTPSVQNTIRRVTCPKSVHFVPKCSF
jgi:hypothetical protein